MSRVSRVVVVSLLLLGIPGISAWGSKIPTDNLALTITSLNEVAEYPSNRLAEALERELRLASFPGRFRLLNGPDDKPLAGEYIVNIVITRNLWETKRAFSIPYILNRYSRNYQLESYVEIPSAADGQPAKLFKMNASGGVRAQYIFNDKYDADLYPNQTERLMTEEKTCRKLAEKLAGYLMANMK